MIHGFSTDLAGELPRSRFGAAPTVTLPYAARPG